MRLLLALLVLVPAASAQTPEPAPRTFALASFAGGPSDNGVAVRILRGVMHDVGGVELGVVSRSAVAVGRDGEVSPRFTDRSVPAAFLEAGPSLRSAVRVGGRGELAVSAGVAIASRFVGLTPFDAGLTAPLEAEATVRVGRRVGVTAAASLSVPLTSVWTDSGSLGEDYTLGNRAVTVGLRFGM